MSDKLTITDCRATGHCVSGIRDFCKHHDLDFRKLVKEGIPLSDVAGIEDAALERMLNRRQERVSRDGK